MNRADFVRLGGVIMSGAWFAPNRVWDRLVEAEAVDDSEWTTIHMHIVENGVPVDTTEAIVELWVRPFGSDEIIKYRADPGTTFVNVKLPPGGHAAQIVLNYPSGAFHCEKQEVVIRLGDHDA